MSNSENSKEKKQNENISAVEVFLRETEKKMKIASENFNKASKLAIDMENKMNGAVAGLNTFEKTISKSVVKLKAVDACLTSFSNKVLSLSKMITENIIKPIDFQISSVLSTLNIPQLSNEEKIELRNKIKKWGKYGWTLMPHIPVETFYADPVDCENADKVAESMCTKEDIACLFEGLHLVKGAKVSDLEEAIFCYENKRYKSCAMILFSLMDENFIRLQKDEDRSKKTGNRETGMRAASNLMRRIKREHKISSKFYMLLSYSNLMSCLNVMFEDTDDFSKDTKIINRNYLLHGMLKREVTRKDCVQLFLVYYNLLDFLEVIDE